MRTKVPAQAGRGENGRVDADGEQPTGRAEDGVVDGYVVGALRERGRSCELCRRAVGGGRLTSSRTQARLSSVAA